MLSIRLPIEALLVVVMLVVSRTPSQAQDFPTVEATRGDLSSRIVEQGEIVCRQNELMRCDVRTQGDSGIVVLWLVPEGTRVKQGDLLVELDDSALSERRPELAIKLQESEARLRENEKVLEKSKLALQKYREVLLPIEELEIETNRLSAKHRLSKSTRKLQTLAAAADTVDAELEEAQIDVQLAEQELKLANLKQAAFEEYQKPTKLDELKSAVDSAHINFEISQAEHLIAKERLADVDKQIAACRIVASAEGVVIYANENVAGGRRNQIIEEGAAVRFNQPIVKIAQLSAFDVDFRVHESQVGQLSPGMEASIRVSAFGNEVQTGVIEEIATIPARQNFLTPNLAEYEVRATLKGANLPLRQGMVAEVSIMTESLEDVVLVPIQAVRKINDQSFCLVRNEDKWDTRLVQTGPSDGRNIVIRAGLMEGEAVAMGAQEADFDPQMIRENTRPIPRSPREDPANTGTPAVVSQYFDTMDRNSNGKLEESELPTTIRRQMKQLDANKDGAIDQQELETWVRRQSRR